MMNIGLIGCSGHYGFALNTAKNGLCRIAAVACGGEDEARQKEIAASLALPCAEDWRAILPLIDVAVVDSRYDLHGEMAAQCLLAGKHVYCEKPLATTLSGLDRLENAWRESGRALGGMLNLRYSSWFLTLSQAVERGEIGTVRLIHGQKSYKLGERPAFYGCREAFGGLIPWVAIHALDWALALGGACRAVSAAQSALHNRGNGDLEVSAAVLMRLTHEVIATVTADYFRPTGAARHDDDRLRVTGTKGMLEAIDGRVWLENDQPRRELPLLPARDPFEAFLRAIDTGAEAFARQALDATRLSLWAREAADTGKTVTL